MRRHQSGQSSFVRGQFGDWDLGTPRIGGSFSSLLGWVRNSGGANRCSGYSLPPVVSSSTSFGSIVGFSATDYWRGTFIHVPGQSGQEVLRRALGFADAPADGFGYPLVTHRNWQIRCLDSLRNGAIDLIFGVLRRPEWATDIAEEALFHDPYCIVGRTGHPLASRERITTDDLLAFDWIVPGEGTPRLRQYESNFEVRARLPAISIETSSLSTIRSVLTCSDRLALVNRQEVETEERSRLLTVLAWTSDAPPMAKGVTTRADWLPTPIQRRFLDLLRVHAGGAAPPPEPRDPHAPTPVQQELMAAGRL